MRERLYNLMVRHAPGLLDRLRSWKRRRKRRAVLAGARRHPAATRATLLDDLRHAGVREGDLLMVHSSLSAMGYVEGGADAVVAALLDAVGTGGTLAMPAFAHNTYSKYYLDTDPVFDVVHSPSRAGAVTERFRTAPGTLRSFHPTDAVCAAGPLAEYLLRDHFGRLTPYGPDSPYARIAEKNGRILCIGVPLLTSCTNLHTLEDAVDFKFPIYHEKTYAVRMLDGQGVMQVMQTRVHDPNWSLKRRPDELVPLFEREGILKHVRIARADAFLIDAAGLFRVMKEQYAAHGVTMYTPHGSD